ncbi:MAG: hypothetical protein WBW31_11815 [Candidatus Sulfotelmatobacter sp.]
MPAIRGTPAIESGTSAALSGNIQSAQRCSVLLGQPIFRCHQFQSAQIFQPSINRSLRPSEFCHQAFDSRTDPRAVAIGVGCKLDCQRAPLLCHGAGLTAIVRQHVGLPREGTNTRTQATDLARWEASGTRHTIFGCD